MAKKVVLPGEELSTDEEFEGGDNTFNENGFVYSDSLGTAEFDPQNYEVKVKKKKTVELFRPGAKVYGVVSTVRKNSVTIAIKEAYWNREPQVFSKSRAALMISQVSRDFVRDIKEMFKKGDIVVAEVSSVKPYAVDLRTNKPELGVIRAYCSQCRHAMNYSNSKLMCTNCGSVEHRKISSEYALK